MTLKTPSSARFPTTRYQGSKRRLLDWIWGSLSHLSFDSALDLFSGTASVAYLFKVQGKAVTTNDYLRCNQTIAQALVCNDGTRLAEHHVDTLMGDGGEGGFIAETFAGLYYTDEENRWLDGVAARLSAMPDGAERALAYFSLYQACLAKRPYNLFHRANLSMRTAEVERGFGNKATWERPFPEHFAAALEEAHTAIFSNGRVHRAFCGDYLDVPGEHDLVYLDPPYLNNRGHGVDYLDFYHFLEGLTEYAEWPRRITTRYKHRPYARVPSAFGRPETITAAFEAAIDRYRRSILVVSYRSDGTPSIEALCALLRRHGRKDARATQHGHRYVLSAGARSEVLLVSEPG